METGIKFVTDTKGRKVAVMISLRKYGKLWEGFCDGMYPRSGGRKKEFR
jgi:hypothetical protein